MVNTSPISHINAEFFGKLPVVRGDDGRITVRHPVYGEFLLRLDSFRLNQDDYCAMMDTLTALHRDYRPPADPDEYMPPYPYAAA